MTFEFVQTFVAAEQRGDDRCALGQIFLYFAREHIVAKKPYLRLARGHGTYIPAYAILLYLLRAFLKASASAGSRRPDRMFLLQLENECS